MQNLSSTLSHVSRPIPQKHALGLGFTNAALCVCVCIIATATHRAVRRLVKNPSRLQGHGSGFSTSASVSAPSNMCTHFHWSCKCRLWHFLWHTLTFTCALMTVCFTCLLKYTCQYRLLRHVPFAPPFYFCTYVLMLHIHKYPDLLKCNQFLFLFFFGLNPGLILGIYW